MDRIGERDVLGYSGLVLVASSTCVLVGFWIAALVAGGVLLLLALGGERT